ncbi:unnamed protein product [Blepharisma stoltei]|uniref:Hydroxysteroid dehydrogenase-like protein 2 n=1 Tax=Blepharisma stoltei TaxID=1481888 RepID=A0AAU9J683_9CILI|nr:unnamed protein product [Blepharisma stoltei]
MRRIELLDRHLSAQPLFWTLKNTDIKEFKTVGNLKGKTIVISGASRGIGLAIAKKAARDGANIAILAKTAEPHKKLEGTIYSAAKEIEEAGGRALPIKCDIRFEDQVKSAVEQTVATFGGIDILINNASYISLTPTLDTTIKSFDLINQIIARGTFMLSKYCIPHLLKAQNPHILIISAPLNMDPKWFAPHLAYTISKFQMSLCTLGLSEEWKGQIGVNSLWPRTAVATAAIKHALGGEPMMQRSRKVDIMADAAYIIMTSCNKQTNGNFFIDDEVVGPHDLKKYNVNPNIPLEELMPDFFIN